MSEISKLQDQSDPNDLAVLYLLAQIKLQIQSINSDYNFLYKVLNPIIIKKPNLFIWILFGLLSGLFISLLLSIYHIYKYEIINNKEFY